VENEPWALAEKQDQDSRVRLATILYTAAEALRIVTALVHPVIPDSSARIWLQLGLGDIKLFDLGQLAWGQLQAGTRLGKVEAVFPRADKSTIERMQQMEQQHTAESGSKQEDNKEAAVDSDRQEPARQETLRAGRAEPVPLPVVSVREPAKADSLTAPPATPPAPQPAAPTAVPGSQVNDGSKITIEDFLKVELRVGEVKVAEKVKGADKLLRMEVDIGSEIRQIVAGIAKAYEPEKLVGRKVVIVANLQPRKLRGLESQGMIVAASLGDQGQPVLAGFLEDVPVGAKLK